MATRGVIKGIIFAITAWFFTAISWYMVPPLLNMFPAQSIKYVMWASYLGLIIVVDFVVPFLIITEG